MTNIQDIKLEDFIEMGVIALSQAEKDELTRLEATIDRNLGAFYEIGMALMTIRDERLYRTEFNTFEEYCRDRWEFNSSRARQLIASADVAQNIKSVTMVTLSSERQARPLTKLEPEKQKEAWQQAVDTAPDGRVTARHVQKIVSDMAKSKKEGNKNEDSTQPIEQTRTHEVSDAMVFAAIAISQLERIRDDDPKRDEALKKVEIWIQKNK